MKNNLKDFSSFLNNSKKQLEDAQKKDQEFRDDVTKRLSDLELMYARLAETVNIILDSLPKKGD